MNTPFQLDQAIARWRAEISGSGSIGSADLNELEAHLRDSFEGLRAPALSEEEAFLIARRRLGGAEVVEEFAKANPEAVWAGRAQWMIFGVLVSKVFFEGARMFANLAALVVAVVTKDMSWSGQATAWNYCLTSFLALGFFVWVVLRLIRGNWSLGDSRLVSFFTRPVVLVVMICLLNFLNIMAMRFIVRILGTSVYSSQNEIWSFIGLGILVAIPVILAAGLAMAQRRACHA